MAVLVCRGFQFTSLDTKYARVLQKSHPGSRLALLTDMDTQFDFDGVDDIEVSAGVSLRQRACSTREKGSALTQVAVHPPNHRKCSDVGCRSDVSTAHFLM